MIYSDSTTVRAFWQAFCDDTGVAADTPHHPRSFSDPRYSMVTDEISELARQGRKRGTAHLVLDFDKNDAP